MRTKNIFVSLVLVGFVCIFSEVTFGQFTTNNNLRCDGNYTSPIQCGYYAEGYQDGVNDVRNNQRSDYRRYRNKYENQYESVYRTGYDKGFSSVSSSGSFGTSNARLSNLEIDVYNRAYNYGNNDRTRGMSRSPERYSRFFQSSYRSRYEEGYADGYSNRGRQYDMQTGYPVNTNVNSGGFGNPKSSNTGGLIWSGRVDGRVNIIISGNTVRTNTITGQNLGQGTNTFTGGMPRRISTVTVDKEEGRGNVRVIQQPSRSNNFTSIVEIDDRNGGADNYRVRILWERTNNGRGGFGGTEEAYSSGKLNWKGRVDQTAVITIEGDYVSSLAQSGQGLTAVEYDIDGYLAERQGTVTVRKREGRGSVSVIEQPSRRNGYVAKIQIFDPKGGDDKYEFDVTW